MKEKLSIAFICDPVGGNKSGVVVATMRFAEELKARSHNVIYIGARNGEGEEMDHSLLNGIQTYRFRSIPLPKSGGWYAALPKVGELEVIFRHEKIDIVHIALPMPSAFQAVKAARALGINVVAHSHSQPENVFLNMPKLTRPIFYTLWNKYLVWLYGKAKVLIYPSKMAESLLASQSTKDKTSVVISNGVNLEEFKPREVGDFYERFNIPKGKVYLLFVGRLFPEKSIDTLIKAIPHIKREHQDAHVLIAGAGYLRPKLEGLVKDLRVEGDITFLGLITEEDKVLAYNASDIFVMPSSAELEGLVVLEAMACGKPIVVSDSRMSASRYFVEGNGFLFEAGNPRDLAEKVLSLITNPALRIAMGEMSLKKVKNYDIHESAKALEDVYYAVSNKNLGMKEDFLEGGKIYFRHNEIIPGRSNIIFVHGLSGSSSAWVEFEKKFGQTHNVYSLDLRGHGKSAKPNEYDEYSLEHMAEDIDELVKHLKIKKPIVISHSFGTLIVLSYLEAHQYEVRGVVLISPSPRVRGVPSKLIKPFLLLNRKLGLFKPSSKPGGHIDYAVHKQKSDWDFAALWKDVQNTSVGAYLFSTEQSLSLDLTSFLSHIHVPTLIIHGERDTIFPVEGGKEMSKKIPNAKLVLIKDADHIIPKNHMAEAIKAIEDFVNTI